jgi:hypothetical protein
MFSRLRVRAAFVLFAWTLSSTSTAAAELQDRTRSAYESYRAGAEAQFLSRQHTPETPPSEAITARPANKKDGIISIPGGLIHHWFGSGFIRDVNLQTVIEMSRNYDAYPSIYKEIVSSRVLEGDDDQYRVLMRLKEAEAGVTAVVDVRATARYVIPENGRVFTFLSSDEIREVRGAGTADEVLLPPGRDSGYLWRLDVFTAFVELPDGVYVERETLGLSRTIPAMLGWFIKPIARRVGRKSVVRSLEEFQAATGATTSSASAR